MTTTFGVAMVRDELDVIEGVLRHMSEEVDGLIVADNGSRDGTRELLHALADELPLWVVHDDDPAYYQSRKMSRLAEMAATMSGAEWIVPFDADEVWYAPDRISVVLDKAAGHGVRIAAAQLTNHYSTAVDPDDADPFRRMAWRAGEPQPLPKVAFRWEPGAVVHQGNHGVTLPSGALASRDTYWLGVRHFPYRTEDQFVRKARNGAEAYKATDLPDTEGAHWRSYGGILERLGEEGLAAVYREHFWFLSPTDSGMVLDPAPYRRWE